MAPLLISDDFFDLKNSNSKLKIRNSKFQNGLR